MKLARKNLIAALDVLGKVVAQGSTLPALRCVRITKDGESAVLQATDLDATMTVRIPLIEVGEQFDPTIVIHKVFADIVKAGGKNGGGTVKLESDEYLGKIFLGIASRKFRVKHELSDNDWPKPKAFPESAERCALYSAADLIPALTFIIPALCKDLTRIHLSHACFNATGLAATDGHRLHMAPLEAEFQGEEFLEARPRAVLAMLKQSDAYSIIVDRDKTWHRWSIVASEGLEIELIEKTPDENFPPIKQIMADGVRPFGVDAAGLASAVTLGIKSGKGDDSWDCGDNPIGLEAKNSLMSVTVSDVFEEELDIEKTEPHEWSGHLNGKYILDAVRGACDVHIAPHGSDLCPVNFLRDDGMLAVIMPLRK